MSEDRKFSYCRDKLGNIDLCKLFLGLDRPTGSSDQEIAIALEYLTAIQVLHPIKSRQVAAVAVANAYMWAQFMSSISNA